MSVSTSARFIAAAKLVDEPCRRRCSQESVELLVRDVAPDRRDVGTSRGCVRALAIVDRYELDLGAVGQIRRLIDDEPPMGHVSAYGHAHSLRSVVRACRPGPLALGVRAVRVQ